MVNGTRIKRPETRRVNTQTVRTLNLNVQWVQGSDSLCIHPSSSGLFILVPFTMSNFPTVWMLWEERTVFGRGHGV